MSTLAAIRVAPRQARRRRHAMVEDALPLCDAARDHAQRVQVLPAAAALDDERLVEAHPRGVHQPDANHLVAHTRAPACAQEAFLYLVPRRPPLCLFPLFLCFPLGFCFP